MRYMSSHRPCMSRLQADDHPPQALYTKSLLIHQCFYSIRKSGVVLKDGVREEQLALGRKQSHCSVAARHKSSSTGSPWRSKPTPAKQALMRLRNKIDVKPEQSLRCPRLYCGYCRKTLRDKVTCTDAALANCATTPHPLESYKDVCTVTYKTHWNPIRSATAH